MNWWPHHHTECYCWVCREQKVGHESDRCHCGRCLMEWMKATGGMLRPLWIKTHRWDEVQPHIELLRTAGYYVSPVGEIEGDVYVEVEAEAVEMWRELVGTH